VNGCKRPPGLKHQKESFIFDPLEDIVTFNNYFVSS